MKAVLPLLEKAALERLDQAAEQASDQVGGRRRIEPTEMLQIVDVSPTFELARPSWSTTTAPPPTCACWEPSRRPTPSPSCKDGAWHVRIPIP
jgi:hypothetical protein